MKSVARKFVYGLALAGIAALAGCAAPPHTPVYDETEDINLVDAVHDSNIRAALLEQHTLYPYHFIVGSAALNELGQRDLAVLAESLKDQQGGELNVRRDDASDALYAARILYVRGVLAHAGVDVDHVQIADGMPGGEGIAGADENRVMTLEHQREAAAASGTQGGTSQSTVNVSTSLGNGSTSTESNTNTSTGGGQ